MGTSAPYYARDDFSSKFAPLSLVWTAVAHVLKFLLRPVVASSTAGQRIGLHHRSLPPSSKQLPYRTSSASLVNNKKEEAAAPLAIVTGSNTGIGFETALALVERGYHVIVACRSRSKGQDAVDRIHRQIIAANTADTNTVSDATRVSSSGGSTGGRAEFLHPLDLSSLASVRDFCQRFQETYGTNTDATTASPLRILVNNAGINYSGTSEDGMDLCFQTNFVGHFLLTQLLLPHLLPSKQPDEDTSSSSMIDNSNHSTETTLERCRVVNLSSVTHHFARADERRARDNDDSAPSPSRHDDPKWWIGCATPGVSDNTYRESKLASILFSMELNRRFASQGLRSIAVNPGSVNSDIWRHFSTVQKTVFGWIYLNSKQGSETSVAAAVGDFTEDAIYLQPYWQPPSLGDLFGHNDSSGANAIVNPTQNTYGVQFPAWEMLGPFIGHAVTKPRLPQDGGAVEGQASAIALWTACESLVQ